MASMCSFLSNHKDFIFEKKNDIKKPMPKSSNVILNSSIDKQQSETIIQNLIHKKHTENTNIINNNTYDDLEIFRGIDKNEHSIVNKIDRTKTLYLN